jgi:hypothetical protein
MNSTYVVGDVHGEYDKLVRLLRDAGLVDGELRWSGGDTTLWFLGDYVDRGPDGVGVVELVMRLQVEADEAAGKVGALLGNHEPVILSALWLGDQPCELITNYELRITGATWRYARFVTRNS